MVECTKQAYYWLIKNTLQTSHFLTCRKCLPQLEFVLPAPGIYVMGSQPLPKSFLTTKNRIYFREKKLPSILLEITFRGDENIFKFKPVIQFRCIFGFASQRSFQYYFMA